jgi:hypothetical protein
LEEETMSRKGYKSGLLAAIMIATVSAAFAQTPAEVPAPDLDPAAVAALERMGAYLRSVKTFRVMATTSRDRVLEDGQLIKVQGKVDTLAQFPNHLRVDVVNDRKQRLYLYDGKSFTLYGKATQYYATVPAPPTIAELANVLADKYDIELPLTDLFRWGTERVNPSDLLAAVDVGPSEVEGTSCEHYAFRQEEVDWQVWIQKGDFPLPRKIVITTMTDEARPQYSAVYTWDLAPSFSDATFTFDPSEDAKRINFATEAPSSDTK